MIDPLKDPKVRQRFLDHVRFATDVVAALKPEEGQDPELVMLMKAVQTNLAITILNYTLGIDHKLRNSLSQPFDTL